MSHLSRSDLETIRDSLTRQKEALLERLRAGMSESEQHHFNAILGQSSGDSSDEALATSIVDLSAARIDLEVRQWRGLEQAARRLDDPGFGICEECGAAIPVERLVANPGAVRCVGCQSAYERTHAGQEHGSL